MTVRWVFESELSLIGETIVLKHFEPRPTVCLFVQKDVVVLLLPYFLLFSTMLAEHQEWAPLDLAQNEKMVVVARHALAISTENSAVSMVRLVFGL